MNVKTKIAAAALNDAIVTLQQLQQRKKKTKNGHIHEF